MIEALARADFLGEASRLALVLLRAGGLVVFCPILGSEVLPVKVRTGIAVALAVTMLPFSPSLVVSPSDTVGWTVVALRELSVGLALGMAARIVFSGIEGAAGLVAGQAGFAFASMVDPLSGEQGLATTLFLNLLSTTLFLAADLHHLFILGLKHSYSVLPPAVALPATSGLAEIVAVLGQRVFTIAVELAAPALVVTLAVDLVMALVGRAAPQLQILTVGYPAKMAMGIVAISILAASTGTAIGWIGKTFTSDGARILSALAAR